LPLLVDHFVRRFGPELGKSVREVSPEVMEVLRRYPWPGNVRELQSVVKQTLLGTTGPVILPEFLPPAVRRGEAGAEAPFDFGGLTVYVEGQLKGGTTSLYADYQTLADRHLLGLVLRHTGGNLSQASRVLGITRATLRTKLAALGMRAERAATDEDAG
jgi:DNA-binding NtrC family response regulator